MTGILSCLRVCKKRNKKAEVVTSASPACWWFFLLSLKGPPSCWRAKPIIKAIRLALYLGTEHCKSSLFILDAIEFLNSLAY
jgi:hypothetical protein